jgi:hypothetical protein
MNGYTKKTECCATKKFGRMLNEGDLILVTWEAA